ncbi:Gfo/Idh/MocA family oxidoreductase [Sphingobacterium sp. UT-1RO-CII-1]|uniref:Gfo/Idh/MocA family protein n=1 Tax=Sphingobacterium sp. UT-1RO-CII-1 TaxID=2995225 RepID=UPI00227C5001|nr:Gfo/Idh/MocA family oxidoreductase [Sphingobacterium sp. UT-1RO-CII-1]MCY4780306.1 Gfo/Idh/MocA family oxidoreductase [Sphingobacterium sp. UT-1RO-CII-1]
MKRENAHQDRRSFLFNLSMLAGGLAVTSPLKGFDLNNRLRVVLVGTGVRGITFWGKRLVDQYASKLQFVGLCDHNKGRLQYAKEYMGVDCPLYTDFDEMMRANKVDLVIVCTKDSTHHEFIIKGLNYGCDVLTEKPLTTDEEKCQQIIDAEKKSDRRLIVGFNYRWGPYVTKIKELLNEGIIGEVTSVDFNWYLNVHHGASYFRRWHGLMEEGGSLWVHKATHHFDLLNWWLADEPEEVFAYGALEHYGSNGPFRGENCRTCVHKTTCNYYWDITKSKMDMNLYVNNEQYDGYVRDNCLFREEIDIYDKMSAQIKYRKNTVVNYSLTTYSPFEGWKIAFNGHKGRIEAWLDIPWMNNENLDQSALHASEMNQVASADQVVEPVILFKSWEDYKVVNVMSERAGHGGGDKRLQDKLFLHPEAPDPLNHAAGLKDGVLSIMVGIAARRSIEQGKPIKIKDLVTI